MNPRYLQLEDHVTCSGLIQKLEGEATTLLEYLARRLTRKHTAVEYLINFASVDEGSIWNKAKVDLFEDWYRKSSRQGGLDFAGLLYQRESWTTEDFFTGDAEFGSPEHGHAVELAANFERALLDLECFTRSKMAKSHPVRRLLDRKLGHSKGWMLAKNELDKHYVDLCRQAGSYGGLPPNPYFNLGRFFDGGAA